MKQNVTTSSDEETKNWHIIPYLAIFIEGITVIFPFKTNYSFNEGLNLKLRRSIK